MSNPPVVKEQEVAVILGFVGRVKIIVMTNRLAVSLSVLYLFVGQDRPVIKPKIPTRRNVSAKLDPRRCASIASPHNIDSCEWRFRIKIPWFLGLEIRVVTGKAGSDPHRAGQGWEYRA